MLRRTLLALSRSDAVSSDRRDPAGRPSGVVARFVAGESRDRRGRGGRRAARGRPAGDLGRPGRGHRATARRPTAAVAAYLDLLAAARRARPRRPDRRCRSSSRRSVRRCPAARGWSRSRAPGASARRRAQRRHHGHPRHGGPHHHRLDAAHVHRAAQGLPGDRGGAAGLPAAHRDRLPRPGAATGPGSGCARAPTTSRRASPSRSGSRSTAPTCGACGC